MAELLIMIRARLHPSNRHRLTGPTTDSLRLHTRFSPIVSTLAEGLTVGEAAGVSADSARDQGVLTPNSTTWSNNRGER